MDSGEGPASRAPRGIQSAAVAVRILEAIGGGSEPLHLREIASAARVDASNTYRYLVSFCAAGMVKQLRDGRYDLGPKVISLGLTALNRLDEFETATAELETLVAETGLDGHISVWGRDAPVVARYCRGSPDLSVQVREGTTFSLLTSATGRVWAAFYARDVIYPLLEQMLAAAASSDEARVDQARDAATIREHGVASSRGEHRPGISALAAPIFSRSGAMRFSYTLVGPDLSFDSRIGGPVSLALQAAAERGSTGLGAPPAAKAGA